MTTSDLNSERAGLRDRLGPVGLWTFQLDQMAADDERAVATEVERWGFGSLWIAEGTASKEALTHSCALLGATEHLHVGTGIANIWARDPTAMASAARYLAELSGGRFVLGIGVSHAGATARRGHDYSRPLTMMREYLDGMAASELRSLEPAIPPPVVLAALRPRMLELVAERAHGAHTYFVTPEHTARARSVLGPGPVLVTEQAVVLSDDRAAATAVARKHTVHYLSRDNYRNNLGDLGFGTDDLDGSGSDRLVTAVVAIGEQATADRIAAHRQAGADHVVVQLLTSDDTLRADDVSRLAAICGVVPKR